MARRCFYCGSEATVDDGGLPDFAVEQVGLADATVEHLVASGRPPAVSSEAPVDALPYGTPSHAELGGRQPVDRLHEAIEAAIERRTELGLADYAARSLCASCARTLGRLDAAAMPLLSPLIAGRRAELDADEQRILAAWAARRAYAALTVERKAQGVPKPHRRAVLDDGAPHENVFVGLGRYRADHVGVLAARLLVPLEPDGVEAYSVLLVLGRLVVKVFGLKRRPEETRVKPPEGEMIRLWPAHAERLAWPPLWALDESTLEQAFLYEPFYRPFRYTEVRYLGPGRKVRAKRKRTEGLGPHR